MHLSPSLSRMSVVNSAGIRTKMDRGIVVYYHLELAIADQPLMGENPKGATMTVLSISNTTRASLKAFNIALKQRIAALDSKSLQWMVTVSTFFAMETYTPSSRKLYFRTVFYSNFKLYHVQWL